MAFDWYGSTAAKPYLGQIDAASAKYGVDPHLIANQIGAESSFNPNAVSSTGAQGLSQILPSTAANPGFGVAPISDPFNPSQAIDFQVAYTQARGGYTAAGLAAYSGGDYSPQTTQNILDGSGGGGIGQYSQTGLGEDLSNDNPSSQLWDSGNASNPLVVNMGTPTGSGGAGLGSVTTSGPGVGSVQSVSVSPSASLVGDTSAAGTSIANWLTNAGITLGLVLLGLVFIAAGLFLFGHQNMPQIHKAFR